MRRCLRRLALLLLAAPAAASAVEPLDTFNARIGGYVTRFDTNIRADGENSDGSRIDLKRDLGLDQDGTLGYIAVGWRPFEHHEFGVSYFRNGVDGERRLGRQISFDGTVYDAAATVRGEYDLDTYEAYYSWWAWSRDTWALGPRVGLTWYRVGLSLEATLDVDGQPVGDGGAHASVRGDVPAPTLGAGWRWTPGQDWRLVADAGWFSAKVDNVDADVYYGRAGVEWYPWEHAGFILDYTAQHIEASRDHGDLDGKVEFDNSGLRLGFAYRY